MERAIGNIYVRDTVLEKAGDACQGHSHNFDHMTQFWLGDFEVETKTPAGEVEVQRFSAPDFLLIKSQNEHKITALSGRSIFFCIYSHRDAQGNVVQEYNGNESSYV